MKERNNLGGKQANEINEMRWLRSKMRLLHVGLRREMLHVEVSQERYEEHGLRAYRIISVFCVQTARILGSSM